MTMSSKAEGFDSPERAALAQAIATLREFDADAAARANAITALEARHLELSMQREQAEKAIGKAREAAVNHLVATARGDAGAAPETVAQARARFEDLDEQYEATKQALVRLQGPEPGLGRSFLVSAVSSAAGAVLAASPPLSALHAEVVELAERFVRQAGALAACASMGIHAPAQTRGPSGEIHGRWYKGFLSMKNDREPNPVAAAWSAAMAALCADANAPLPGEGRAPGSNVAPLKRRG